MTSFELIEKCARIAETVEVPCYGHPQIDAPTIGDARKIIASTIRSLVPVVTSDVVHPNEHHEWTHPLIREDRPE